ncbi:hypothetical protein TREMEDRAFT_32173, partial [Tremella mesenterica DSM 1558]|uniref:uncharacterized protein n=1 Tax=Tremella mesenterica (strain ATCC 24925 / CBS 8224 / DSM 1558 / NBRC 9311 / NRRL Y-6157 / RJB 2259-6 / UBC 559-6) TaxID=578456 RepID=UPI0003F4A255
LIVIADLNIRTVSSQSAWVAVAQVPLIIALVGKNNLISFLIGVSHEKLNYLHRAAGRVCLVGVWIHFGCMLSMHHGITKGTVGVASFTLMTVLSIRTIRHRLYEFFLVAHICLAVLTLAAFIKHWSAMGPWIYPGFGLWAADRILRVVRLFVLNKLWVVMPSPTGANIPSRATLTLLTPSTVMVSFQTPSRLLTWAAGQHFFVVMPGMTRFPWEAHPFTAATLPARPGQGTGKGELTFIVRVRDGFTKRMKDHVDEERKARGLGPDVQVSVDIPAAVEGPYGESRSLDRYDGVLILTGGSGISYGIAHLMQIVRDAREGKTRVKFVRIIWMVKTRCEFSPPSLCQT